MGRTSEEDGNASGRKNVVGEKKKGGRGGNKEEKIRRTGRSKRKREESEAQTTTMMTTPGVDKAKEWESETRRGVIRVGKGAKRLPDGTPREAVEVLIRNVGDHLPGTRALLLLRHSVSPPSSGVSLPLLPLPLFSFTSSSFPRPSLFPYLVFPFLLFRLNPFAFFCSSFLIFLFKSYLLVFRRINSI